MYNEYDEVHAEAMHDYYNQRDLFRDDYDHDYEDDPHYRALYMQPGDVYTLDEIIRRIVNIGVHYSVMLPVFYTPAPAWDNDDLPF